MERETPSLLKKVILMLLENKKELTKDEFLELINVAVSIFLEYYDDTDKRYHTLDFSNDTLTYDNHGIDFDSKEKFVNLFYNIFNNKRITKALITPTLRHKTYEYYENRENKEWFKLIREDGKE